MLCWLAVWAAEVMNKFKLQEDGRTAYEAISKHQCTHLVVGFGELIHWQMAPAKPNPDKLHGDWRDGIFLGVIWKSGEYVVGTAEAVLKCSTIKKRPTDNAYDSNCIDCITTSYDDYILKGAKSEGAKLRFAPNVTPIAATPILAREEVTGRPDGCTHCLRILRLAYTVGCPGCVWMQNKLGTIRGHNNNCRDRMAK